ncbi:MAG: single-stranded DNA-binding protein [Acidobacteriota bacterium]|nr:single-stranded DNA-binding protein [Acidobacteriota bacterium]
MTHPFGETEHDTEQAAKKVADYLASVTAKANLDLAFDIQIRKPAEPSPAASSKDDLALASTHPPSTNLAATNLASPSLPALTVDLSGPDTPLLLARNGELLHALEHLAAKILGLEPEQHDRISFDAEDFKAHRDQELISTAEAAIQLVRESLRPYSFPPMNSRERRMLHLILAGSGLPTASSGEGPRRFVVLYPEGSMIPSSPSAELPGKKVQGNSGNAADRAAAIRSRFRRR